MAQRHELLRSRFWRKDGKLVQSCDGKAPELELKPLSKSNGAVQGLIQVIITYTNERHLPAAVRRRLKSKSAESPRSAK